MTAQLAGTTTHSLEGISRFGRKQAFSLHGVFLLWVRKGCGLHQQGYVAYTIALHIHDCQLIQVFKLTYCQSFRRSDYQFTSEVCKDFIESVKAIKPSLLNRPKFHLVLHLPQCMLDFGRTSSFNTERYHLATACIITLIIMLLHYRQIQM